MVTLLLSLVLACADGDEPTVTRTPKPPKKPAKVSAPAAINAIKAKKSTEDGWGAVFWRNATAWKIGGGDTLVSPRASAQVRPSGEPLTCDGVAVKGAPAHAALALPEGTPQPDVMASPAIQAHRVERAAWRLDEILPPRGRFDPKVSSNQPSKQRGIEVGSVSKTRRYGAPPFLIATGVRSCSGAVIITDLKAEKTLAYDRLPQTCTPLRVIPALDYDGDGNREFAVFSEERVALYRLTERPGTLHMDRIGEWYCAIKP